MSWYQDGHGYGGLRRRKKKRGRGRGRGRHPGSPYQQIGISHDAAAGFFPGDWYEKSRGVPRRVQSKYHPKYEPSPPDIYGEPYARSSRRHPAVDMGQGAEVLSMQHDTASMKVDESPMYAAPADVPMQELDASPGVPPGMQIEPPPVPPMEIEPPPVPPMEGPPPGMPAPPPGLSGPYMVAAPDQAVREFKAPPAAHDPTRHVSRDRRREQVLEQSKGLRAAALQARRDTGDTPGGANIAYPYSDSRGTLIRGMAEHVIRRDAPPGLDVPESAARSAQKNVAAHRRMGLRTINQQPSYKPLGPIAGINRPVEAVDEPEIPAGARADVSCPGYPGAPYESRPEPIPGSKITMSLPSVR